LGCLYSMERIEEPNSKYLLSKVNDKDEFSIFMSMNDIALRSKRSQVLKTLYDDKLGNPSFAVRAFAADSGAATISDRDIVDQLFMQGFITAGMELALCMDKVTDCKPNGRSILFDVVSQLVLDFLLPLAWDKYQTPKRPTIHQLQTAIAYMKGPTHHSNTALVAHRSTKYADLEQGPLRAGAMLLIEMLTVKFTADESPLACEVASEMLSPHRVHTQLPLWLEELLLTGTNKCDLPGLFSRRRKPGVDGYLGNPTVLLTVYIKRGMVKDACRVVTRIFNDFNSNRGHLAASRLPESGEIDYIPFDKIKLLWSLVDIRLGKVHLLTARRELESARMEMKASLDEYFRLSKITEMGQQSARSLK
jgi:RNA binding exosome subunit